MVRIAVLGFLLAALGAAPASGQTLLRDAVVGSGAGGFGISELGFQVDVTSGPGGEAPSGSASFSSPVLPGGTFAAISCLSVAGNVATLAGPLEPGVPGDPAFGKMILTDDDPIGLAGAAVYDAAPDCSPTFDGASAASGPWRLSTGDVTVLDDVVAVNLPDVVFGSGAGQFFGEMIGLNVHASSDPNGENPRGTLSVNRRGARIFEGLVTSLRVLGSTATVEARDFAGASLLLLVEDRPAGDHVTLNCTAPGCFPPAFFDFVLSAGDIVIREAPSLPTSKNQCKKGGWRSFGVFKNQGDCVSFVATGGGKGPAS
jgi:hypothetical protein